MAGPVAHTFAAYAALITVKPKLIADRRSSALAWGTAFLFGNLADADFTRNPVLQHHYFSHSIPFAFLITFLCIAVLKALRYPHAFKTGILLGMLYGTHLLIDYFTDDGSAPFGIPLLWPFTNRHFWSPVILFYATHRNELFSKHNVTGLLIEIALLLPIVGLARFRAHRELVTTKTRS
jgi:membrane-bound metal-dependent hydrolase YbcI (DUF457 family)